MRSFIIIIFFYSLNFSFCQEQNLEDNCNRFDVNLEYLAGKTSPPNYNFPKLNAFQSFLVGIRKNSTHRFEWEKNLDFPVTGLDLSYTNFGNKTTLGKAFSITPFLEMSILKERSKKFSLKSSLGLSYFTTIYDSISNPDNKAISTQFTWAFRLGLYYKLFKNNEFTTKLGLVYFHNSNGHMRLPNNGLNSIAISLSSIIKNCKHNEQLVPEKTILKNEKIIQNFYNFRLGIGQKVFSKKSYDLNEVFVIAASKGIIIDKTFKIGYGFCYRFYEDYYNLNKNEILLSENKSIINASNLALFISGELLMNRIGAELELGVNLYKPTYKEEYIENHMVWVNGKFEKPNLGWYYVLKKTISSRLGLKYYFKNMNTSPKANFYIGTFINANFGQADFTELSVGYIYCLDKKKDNHR